MKRFPWVLTVFVALVLTLLIGLGVWQVQRLKWKEGLIDQSALAAMAPPAPLSEVLRNANPEFRRAILTCPGLDHALFVELYSIIDGEAGSRLISPCRVSGLDSVFLVDRGFVADTDPDRPGVAASQTPVSLMVELRRTPDPGPLAPPRSEGKFYARDSAAIATALGVGQVSPYTLFALTSSNPESPALKPSAPPAAFSNNHLGYAMTWFGLAIALMGFYVAMVRRRLRKDPT